MSGAEPIAVVGMACVYPGAPDVETFWENIVAGHDAIVDAPPDRIDPRFFGGRPGRADHLSASRGGFVDGESLAFEPGRFGIMPVTVDQAEPDQLLALKTAARALEDAGDLDRVDRARVGVVLGRGGYLTPAAARLGLRVRTANQLLATLTQLLPDVDAERLVAVRDAFADQLGELRPEGAIGLVPNLAASRIANRLDLGGPAYTVDAACASALVAVDLAASELRARRCDAVLAGGVHHCDNVTLWSVFSQLGALSASGEIRPFSRHADGVLIAEGTGILALERLSDAVREGRRVYAVVRGTGVASDGRHASLMSPQVDGQVRALERAYRAADLAPGSVGLLEGHGTGTPAGDQAELETIRAVYGAALGPRRVLGSVKSNIGHAMPAAGAAGLIKAVLAVYHGVLPPTLHAEEPHPALAGTPFRLLDEAEPWAEGGGRRTSAVNAFGFGGINAHAIVEQHGPGRRQARARAPRGSDYRFEAIMLAGRDARDLAGQLAGISLDRLAGVAPGGPARVAIVDPTPARLALAARVVARGQPWRGHSDIWFEPRGLISQGGRVAFLLPGLEPVAPAVLEDVQAWFGLEMAHAPAGASELERRCYAMFEGGRLLHRALAGLGVAADDVAGHSLGEWTAAFVAELIPADLADGFLRELEPGGLELPGVVFAALGCGAELAAEVIEDLADVVVSHDNCPHQSLICGREDAIDEACRRFAARRILAQRLPFRTGFHSPFIGPYLDVVRHHWRRMPLQAPRVRLWSATTCERYPSDAAAVRELAIEHLVRPVLFRGLLERLHADGVRVFVQLGVGSLTSFCDDTLRDRPQLSIAAAAPARPGLDQLGRVAAALWAEGLDVRVDRLLSPRGTRRAGLADDGPSIRLALGTPFVSLPDSVSLKLAPSQGPTNGDARRLASPRLQSELDALLADTVSAGAALADALAAPASTPRAASAETVAVSVACYPWLADHCFFRQPPGASLADRFPVVPMTTIIEWLEDAARRLAPGLTVTRVEGVRAMRWLVAAPATRVVLSARRVSAGRVEATIEGFARASIHLAAATPPAPAPSARPLANPRPSPVDARSIYAQNRLFHGAAFQGLLAVDAIGDDGIDGTIEALATPGGWLDNAGQLYGWWLQATADVDSLAFPETIDSVEYFGARPRPGERVATAVRVTELMPRTVRADLELVQDGAVVTRISGWVDRRFDTDEHLWRMLRDPEHRLVARPTPPGHVAVQERWRDAASRELMARRYLDAGERRLYESLNPREQRLWLLGRVAAKDAVRHALWSDGHGPLFPIEVPLVDDGAGAVAVRDGPARGARVAVAQLPWIAVAAVEATIDGENGGQVAFARLREQVAEAATASASKQI